MDWQNSIRRQNSASQQGNPENTNAWLRKYHPDLAVTYPSCDLSEMSYQTDLTDFPGSRHSSLNTEPLTLDAEQMHEAKDQAVDVIEAVGPEEATQVFTKDLEVRSVDAAVQDSETDQLEKQLNSLVEKAQQVVDANELHSQSLGKTADLPPTPAASNQTADSHSPPLEKPVQVTGDLRMTSQTNGEHLEDPAAKDPHCAKES